MLAALAIASPARAGEEPLTIDQAIALALSANRSLAAARLGREVARAGVAVAGQRPNPDLSIEAERETPHEAYTLALPIETAGKRRRRVDAAEAAAQGNESEIARLEIDTRVAVRRAFYALLGAQRRVAEIEQVVSLAQRTRDAAKDRFESGDAPRLEVLQADLNLAQSNNELGSASAVMTSARIALNTLLALPPDQPTSAGGDLDAGQVPEAATAVDLALRSSADLSLLDRRIAEQEARLVLARAERVPDLVVEGAVTRRAQPEFDTGWRAGVALSLPVLNQHRGEVRLEEAALQRLRSERTAAEAQVRGLVSAALIVATARRAQYVRYRDEILPQAAEVERLAGESYGAGQSGLVTMLQAFGAVRDIRLKSVDSGLDYQEALADLEQAMGAPLP